MPAMTDGCENFKMEFVLIERFAKRLIYFILVSITALLVYHYLPHVQGNWLIWSALVFAWVAIGDTVLQRINMIAVSACIAAIVLFVIGMISANVWLVSVFLILVTLFCVYGSLKKPGYHLALLFINIIAITASQNNVTFDENMLRSGLMLASAFIAGIPQLLFLYHEKQNKLVSVTSAALIELKHIQTELFASYLQSDYPERRYFYERRIHVCSHHFMKILSRYAVKSEALSADSEKTIEELLSVYSALQTCGQLRWRIHDFTVFALCRDEMKRISQTLDKVLSCDLRQKESALANEYIQSLEDQINRLEGLYEHVLKVAGQEPLAILLFLAGLRSLCVELRKLYGV
jgi:hypothetical protein